MLFFTKTLSWIKNHKTLTAILLFFASLLVIAVVLSLLLKKPQVPSQPAPQELNLVSVTPQGNFKSIWPSTPIVFSFDQPIDENSIRYDVSPTNQTKIIFDRSQNQKSFSIIPLTGWTENKDYVLTINKNTASVDGVQLSEDIQVKIKRTFPKPGDPEFPQEIPEEKY